MLVGIVAGYWTSQAWIIAVITSVILAPLAYALGYRKALTPLSMLLPSLLGVATTFAVTWYTAHLNYGYSEGKPFLVHRADIMGWPTIHFWHCYRRLDHRYSSDCEIDC